MRRASVLSSAQERADDHAAVSANGDGELALLASGLEAVAVDDLGSSSSIWKVDGGARFAAYLPSALVVEIDSSSSSNDQ